MLENIAIDIPEERPAQKAQRLVFMYLHESMLWKNESPEFFDKQTVKYIGDVLDCFKKMSQEEIINFFILFPGTCVDAQLKILKALKS